MIYTATVEKKTGRRVRMNVEARNDREAYERLQDHDYLVIGYPVPCYGPATVHLLAKHA